MFVRYMRWVSGLSDRVRNLFVGIVAGLMTIVTVGLRHGAVVGIVYGVVVCIAVTVATSVCIPSGRSRKDQATTHVLGDSQSGLRSDRSVPHRDS